MSKKIVIDPVSRSEGHLKIEAVVEGGVVKEARSSGMLFRGLETILGKRQREGWDSRRGSVRHTITLNAIGTGVKRY